MVTSSMLAMPAVSAAGIAAPAAANSSNAVSTNTGSQILLTSQSPITSGAVLKKYVWKTMRGQAAASVNVNVVEVDLTNPNVKLDMMTGAGGQFTKKNTVSGMAQETGAVAGVNGDFFNTQAEGVPDGPEIAAGQVMATPLMQMQGMYSFAIDHNNQPIIDSFSFQGSVAAKDGSSFPLRGINKTSYWLDDGTYGMTDGMFIYTSAFASDSRSNDGAIIPSEILVQNGVIQQIALNSVIPGLVPTNAYILRTNGKATDYVKQHLKVGDPLKVDDQIIPIDSSKNYDTKQFKMMVGGETLLVVDGKPSILTRDINNFSGYA